ncbi:acetylglutamate kinase [Turneriella parva]|uniref:Acetylglutamate kinase n=1 Tax=Turneriella parva (strain ATCC BAA-1111 / DSM 21527 / NCTC 11395 / H) TaxID=869212 RepID=I4B819_TURPD|nr:acetylglutamate kinase [Turneriella parva]AFM13426.1 N-acetylglutamate kinase [Turneriella parva DSM 21527]
MQPAETSSHSLERIGTLLEALPYIQRFAGKTIVIKYGGNAMEKADLSDKFAQDVVLLKLCGIDPVIVHGGGPQINSLLARLGVKSEFVDGHRVTGDAEMEAVEMVLSGDVNKKIVAQIARAGGKAVGISGRDGGLARAERHALEKHEGTKTVHVDLGRVGNVKPEGVNTQMLTALKQGGFIPVIAPVAFDEDGNSLNVNADTMAGAIASALGAEKLLLLTDTSGVMHEGKTLTRLTPADVERLKNEAVISGGMIPKTDCAVSAVEHGVTAAHIIDGRVPHALLLEIFTDTGVGTMILR